MSKWSMRGYSWWPMRGHSRYLRLKTFPMTPRTPQCEVFWALLSSSKHSGVPEDSKSPTFPSVGLHPHTWPKWGCDKRSHSMLNYTYPWGSSLLNHDQAFIWNSSHYLRGKNVSIHKLHFMSSISWFFATQFSPHQFKVATKRWMWNSNPWH